MNTSARRTAIKWQLTWIDAGISRFPDAEVQAELAQDKIRYQHELNGLECRPRQLMLVSIAADDSEVCGVKSPKQAKRGIREIHNRRLEQ